MSLQQLISDAQGNTDTDKLLRVLQKKKEGGQEYPWIVIPNETTISQADLIFDFPLYTAMAFDYPEMSWTVFSTQTYDINTILRTLNEPFVHWKLRRNMMIDLILQAPSSLPIVIACLIADYTEYPPDTLHFSPSLLGADYAICDEGYIGCVKCIHDTNNPVMKWCEINDNDIKTHNDFHKK